MAQKVLLLYSGGLDTSVMIRWIKENLGYDVVTLTLDVGQDSNDLDAIAQKAVKIGAVDTITKDVKEEFVRNYAFKDVKADGLYQGTYPLSTAVARPLMASVAVEVAHDTGCSIIAHGCTGKGNDQVRFDLAIRSLDSTLKVIAPVRDWNMNRDQEAEYARKHGIPVKNGGKYSTDENLWGRSVEGSDLEDPSMPVPEDAYLWVTPPLQGGRHIRDSDAWLHLRHPGLAERRTHGSRAAGEEAQRDCWIKGGRGCHRPPGGQGHGGDKEP